MVERSLHMREIAGSIPAPSTKNLTRQVRKVTGSTPVPPTIIAIELGNKDIFNTSKIMQFEKELAKFQKKINKKIEKFLDKKISEVESVSQDAPIILTNLKNYLLRPAKRIRPAFFYFTYRAFGGKPNNAVWDIALAIEFLHNFLLIHDDIIDRDELRRNESTIHYFYQKLGEKKFKVRDAVHFGNSQAICIGDIVFGFVFGALGDAKISSSLKIAILKKIDQIILQTGLGEMADVTIQAKDKARVEDVLNILEYKTARYTFAGPMHLGALLAGASPKYFKKIYDYTIPLGIAFQIRDDILGLFGNQSETGKPVGRDVAEGKKTLLIVKAFQRANNTERKAIKAALGNPNISLSEINRVRQIVQSTDSLRYCEKFSKKLAQKAKISLRKFPFNRFWQQIFSDLANYIIKRDH